MGGGSGTQLGGAIGGDTGSWWSLDDGPDSWRPTPAALRDLRIISLRRRLHTETKSNDNLARKISASKFQEKANIKRLNTLLYTQRPFSVQTQQREYYYYPLLLEEPVLFPELLLETTEIALAMASTADRRSANVFLSDLSASEMKYEHLACRRVTHKFETLKEKW